MISLTIIGLLAVSGAIWYRVKHPYPAEKSALHEFVNYREDWE